MDLNISICCDALTLGNGDSGNGGKKGNDGGQGSQGLGGLENPGNVICSICLDQIIDNGIRAWAKLRCGHFFHLDCIGSAFNFEDAMKCPNCREVEQGDWRYATGPGSQPLDAFDLFNYMPMANDINVLENNTLLENEVLQANLANEALLMNLANDDLQVFMANNALQPPLANEPPHLFQDAQQHLGLAPPQEWLWRYAYEDASYTGYQGSYAHPYQQAARSFRLHNQIGHGRYRRQVPSSLPSFVAPIQVVLPVAQDIDATANAIAVSQAAVEPPFRSNIVGFTDSILARFVANPRNSFGVAGDTDVISTAEPLPNYTNYPDLNNVFVSDQLSHVPVSQSYYTGRNWPRTSVAATAAGNSSEPNVVEADYMLRISEAQRQDQRAPGDNRTVRLGTAEMNPPSHQGHRAPPGQLGQRNSPRSEPEDLFGYRNVFSRLNDSERRRR